jgi:hypothetical protein
MSYHLQSTFSRGEADPELVTRPDLELFRAALAECENFITLKRGGFRRRGGTRFNGEVKDSTQGAWFLPFDFGSGQAYMLEAGELYFRVHTSGGRVGTVDVVTPYPLAVLADLKFVQSTDTLFVAGGGIRPHAIKRLAETNWTIEPMEFQDGPYLPVNISATNLIPADTGNPVPVMTANNAPSGTVASSNGSAEAYKLFVREEGKVVLDTSGSGWVSYEFPAATVIDGYMLQAPSDNGQHDDMPAKWSFEASNNGTDWAVLDTQDGEAVWTSNEWRRFAFPNETAYTHYRLRFSEGGGSPSDNSAIGQIVFHQAASDQSPFELEASDIAGVNGGAGFEASDLGRHIRLRGNDGYWRWATVESVTSTTVVEIRLYGHSLLDTSGMSMWRLGSWSDRTGWPETIGWHKNRLAFGSTNEEPLQVWESQTEDFLNMTVSQPLVASDAVSVPILSGQMNKIKWLADDDDLLVGTSRAVRAIGKATAQDPYGPDNVDQRPQTNFGANGVSPIQIGSVILYFGRFGTDMRELAYNLQADGRVSQSVSEIQSHMFRPGISGACYQQYPDSIIWPWDQNGKAVGFTYEREQEVFGMHRHNFGGVIECMATIPGVGFDEVWMLVRREINGQTKRYIEIMQKPFVDADIEDAWHLDCAVLYEGAPVNAVAGLDHLEGQSVILYADGSDYYTTVESGEVSLPNEQSASKILVGLDVKARAKTLPPPVNAQDGASMGRKIKITDAKVSLFQTGSLQVGSDDTAIDEQILYREGDDYGAPVPLRTGTIDADFEMRWDEDGQVVFEVSGGKPCTVLAVNYNVAMEP